jgi:hypothetical protein
MNVFIIIALILLLALVIYICCKKEQKETYSDGTYRKVSEWGNTPPLAYKNGWYIGAPPGSQYCAACEDNAKGCACNRLSSDMSDPYRTRYPIDLPAPFEAYELPGQICPKCLQVIKTSLQ